MLGSTIFFVLRKGIETRTNDREDEMLAAFF
jgi:hypothetical protein